MYYIEGLDQLQIGERLGVSKSAVSRILRNAKDDGVIEFRIIDDEWAVERDPSLEVALAGHFNLREVRVGKAPSPDQALDVVARLGAEVFAQLAPGATRIGFGWGETMQRLTDAIVPVRMPRETTLTSLVGGMPTLDTAPSGNNMLVTLAERCGIRADRFDAPAVVESEATYSALMKETSVKRALTRARASDLAFVGVGSHGVRTSRLVSDAMNLDAQEEAAFMAQGPAGDMCGYFFDDQGRALGPPSAHRVVGLTTEELVRIPTVVAAVAGLEKQRGARAALATGAVDVLVTDAELARALLPAASSTSRPPAGAYPDGTDRPTHCPHCGHALD